MTFKLFDCNASLKALLAASMLGLFLGAAPAKAEEIETLVPGTLTIGMLGDMPMTGTKDGKVIGTDGALAVKIAETLGLEVATLSLEWNSLIQATTQGQVDVLIGSVGWTEDRSKVMLLSDPVYFFGTLLIQKKDSNWNTFEDMKGRTVGTVTGFTLVPELKSVEGIGEVKLYDTQDAVCAISSPVASIWASSIRRWSNTRSSRIPDWGIHQIAVTAGTREVSDHVEEILFDLCDADEPQAAGRRHQRRDRQALGRLQQRQVDGRVRPGRQVLVHAAGARLPGGVDRPEGWTSPKAPDSCFQ